MNDYPVRAQDPRVPPVPQDGAREQWRAAVAQGARSVPGAQVGESQGLPTGAPTRRSIAESLQGDPVRSFSTTQSTQTTQTAQPESMGSAQHLPPRAARWGGPRIEAAPAPAVRVIETEPLRPGAEQVPGYVSQVEALDPAAPQAVVHGYESRQRGAGQGAPALDALGYAAPSPGAGQGPRTSAGVGRIGLGQAAEEGDLNLDAVLTAMVASGASDLHLTVGAPPMFRRNGLLVPLDDHAPVAGDSLQRTLFSILSQRQRETFEDRLELDFSYSVRGVARFRVNFYQQRESIGAAFRVIPYEIKALEDLGVPAVVANFAGLPRGLVLVTGPTGSGKSTTLAAIIDLANRTRSDHIMTVEDPIEFLHEHKRSIINQREVGADTHSFADALKHVLRQDPDIILVGEMRDLETISVALSAAETGHLVFATLHTQDAAQTVDRIIDVFPPEQQGQVRTQLSGTLQGVVSQTLCRRTGRPGRVVATEVMVATPAIRNLIREGKTHQLYSAMQAGQQAGMHTLDQHLADLVRSGVISYETGIEKCHHMEDFAKLTGHQSRMNQGGAVLQQAATSIGGL